MCISYSSCDLCIQKTEGFSIFSQLLYCIRRISIAAFIIFREDILIKAMISLFQRLHRKLCCALIHHICCHGKKLCPVSEKISKRFFYGFFCYDLMDPFLRKSITFFHAFFQDFISHLFHHRSHAPGQCVCQRVLSYIPRSLQNPLLFSGFSYKSDFSSPDALPSFSRWMHR